MTNVRPRGPIHSHGPRGCRRGREVGTVSPTSAAVSGGTASMSVRRELAGTLVVPLLILSACGGGDDSIADPPISSAPTSSATGTPQRESAEHFIRRWTKEEASDGEHWRDGRLPQPQPRLRRLPDARSKGSSVLRRRRLRALGRVANPLDRREFQTRETRSSTPSATALCPRVTRRPTRLLSVISPAGSPPNCYDQADRGFVEPGEQSRARVVKWLLVAVVAPIVLARCTRRGG